MFARHADAISSTDRWDDERSGPKAIANILQIPIRNFNCRFAAELFAKEGDQDVGRLDRVREAELLPAEFPAKHRSMRFAI
jgi:hypothetical protein